MFTRFLIILITLSGLATAPALAVDIITPARFAILMDHESGEVLYAKNPDAPMKPASMAKMMTAYLLFNAIRDGSVRMDDTFRVSRKAYRMGGSRTFLEAESEVTVSDLLRGIIVQSGNDASVAVAEGLAGTEEAFAEEMTRIAKKLGMQNTVFANSTGWPHEDMTTTARDLAILARAIITGFPELYKIYDETSFTYNGIRQGNRNPLLYTLDYADGLKTGHTEESGYGLAASAARDGQRFILVINGLNSSRERREESRRLMTTAFRAFKAYTLLDPERIVLYAPVTYGEETSVGVTVSEKVRRFLQAADYDELKREIVLDPDISAPIEKGQRLGEFVLTIGGKTERHPAVAVSAVERLPLHKQAVEFFNLLIFGAEAPPPPPVYDE